MTQEGLPNTSNPKVDELIDQMIKLAVEKSRMLITQIDSSKTDVKRNFYKKKLKKNNAELARYLLIKEKRRSLLDVMAKHDDVEKSQDLVDTTNS